MLSEREIDGIVARIVAAVRPERVVVFGSYARGDATADSDLDLLVIVDTDVPRLARAALVRPHVGQHVVEVDIHVRTPAEADEGAADRYSFLDTAQRYGRVVYRRPPSPGPSAPSAPSAPGSPV